MKITIIGPTYPFRGGISHYTTLLCQHLRQDHEVRFFTFSRQYPALLFPGKSDRDEASEAVLRVEGEALLDGVNPWTWWQVGRAIGRDEPDMLIVQWTVSYWIPMLWLLMRLAPSSTCKVMICHNAAPHEKDKRWLAPLMAWLQRQVMGQTDHLICHAESDEQLLRAMLPNHTIKRVMLPSYAGLATLASRGNPLRLPSKGNPLRLPGKGNPLRLPFRARGGEGKPHLLFFGFVRPYNGVDLLFEAMPKVLAALPEARLTVAGEWGAAAGDPQKLLPQGLYHAIEIRNRYLANEEMAALFAEASVVVLPYRSATQSAVVQLAYGFGLPVITTAVGGLPEAVLHEESGFIVPPNDANALADAIIRYHTEGWRERLVKGVEEARGRFSWEAMVKALEQLSADSLK
jgi:glycosyltransferase involved in cell wall biosynthesis